MSFGATVIPEVKQLRSEQFATPSTKQQTGSERVSGWTSSGVVPTEWRPLCDIKKSKDFYILQVELPGIEKKDISLTVEDGVLCLSGERPAQGFLKEGEKLYRSERIFGTFRRMFEIPKNVDMSSIMANFSNGLLEIRIPRSHVKPIEIPAQGITATQAVSGPDLTIGHTKIGNNFLIPISEGFGGGFVPYRSIPGEPSGSPIPVTPEIETSQLPASGTVQSGVKAVHEPKDPGLVCDIGGELVGPELGFVQKVVPESEQVMKPSEKEVWMNPAREGESLKRPWQRGLQKELGPEKEPTEMADPTGGGTTQENPEERTVSRQMQI